MEIVIYGCGNEIHNSDDDQELYSQYFSSQQNSLAVGFNVKQPPICDYCLDKIYKLVDNSNLKLLTLAFLSNMPRIFMEKLYQIIKANLNIEKLHIRWADAGLLDEKMIEFLSETQRKEINFKLDAARIDDNQGEKILKQLEQNKLLENLYLSMNGNMIGDKSLIKIQNILQTSAKKLKNLSLSLDSNEINDNNSSSLGKGLSYLNELESLTLNLDECIFDSEGIKNITNYLPKSISKFSFSFNDNMIGDENLQSFSDNMKFDPNKLVELDLSFAQNEFGDDGIKYLFQKISQFQELQKLSVNFRSNSISDEGLSSLFESLSKLKKLQSLQLNISGLYQETQLQNIELFLKETQNLKQLTINMQDDTINPKGIQKLAEGITENKSIFDLSLNFFYGNIENLDHLLISIIDQILNHKRSFGELNIISDQQQNMNVKELLELLNLICLSKFEQVIKIIQFQKLIKSNEVNNKYILDLLQ